MSVKIATIDDAHTIAGIHVASRARGYHGLIPPPALAKDPDIAMRSADWQGWLRKTQARLLYDDQGVAVGFVSFGPLRTRLAGDRGPIPRFAGEVYALYVHPDHWRKGYGKTLLRAGFDGLKDAGFPSALLWVIAKNDPAIALYLNAGGEKCGKRTIDMNGFTIKETAIGFRRI